MKIGKQLNLANEKDLNIKYGYVDKFLYPNSNYIKINGWVKFKNDYTFNNKLNKDIKIDLKKILNLNNDISNIIIDVNVSEHRLSSNNVTYLNLIVNYFNPEFNYQSKEFKTFNKLVSDKFVGCIEKYFDIVNKKSLN